MGNIHNLKDAGKACIGCGNTNRMLMRLRTYSLSLCCAECFLKYAKCANRNPEGTPCNHDPVDHVLKTGPCSMPGCGCQRWIHGLEGEHDRQYAESVGQKPTSVECNGYGANLGKCGNAILATVEGQFPRLCSECERNWRSEIMEAVRGDHY